jgi:hypothetical protein
VKLLAPQLQVEAAVFEKARTAAAGLAATAAAAAGAAAAFVLASAPVPAAPASPVLLPPWTWAAEATGTWQQQQQRHVSSDASHTAACTRTHTNNLLQHSLLVLQVLKPPANADLKLQEMKHDKP